MSQRHYCRAAYHVWNWDITSLKYNLVLLWLYVIFRLELLWLCVHRPCKTRSHIGSIFVVLFALYLENVCWAKTTWNTIISMIITLHLLHIYSQFITFIQLWYAYSTFAKWSQFCAYSFLYVYHYHKIFSTVSRSDIIRRKPGFNKSTYILGIRIWGFALGP